MIPERFVEFFRGPLPMLLGTRDKNLYPSFSRPMGGWINEDRETITFLIHEREAERIQKNLQDNGRIALTVAEMPSHETYQFKGSFVSLRKTQEHEMAFQQDYRQSLAERFKTEMGIEEEYWLGYAFHPSVAITFRVEVIYNQTPGPGAGEEID